ncbi:hypothetical protein BC833DRAFT_577975 [Globomyces pollinis-pini]|nr:hypothetical protein BC833DRAFT_577975 [Globomyces pollinis-pini]
MTSNIPSFNFMTQIAPKKLDFHSLAVPTTSNLTSNQQTPNGFLASIPKLNMEINHFAHSFATNNHSPNLSQNQIQQPIIQQQNNGNLSNRPLLPNLQFSINSMDQQKLQDNNFTNTNGKRNISQMDDWSNKRRASISLHTSINPQPYDHNLTFNTKNIPSPEHRERERSNSISAKSDTTDPERLSFLERNRKAALKCRQKKKNYVMNLEKQVESLSSENESLHAQVNKLREHLLSLKTVLACHQDCHIPQTIDLDAIDC